MVGYVAGADPGGVQGVRTPPPPLLRVPFLDYRNSIASKIDATHVIKNTLNHTVSNALKCRKMNQRVFRFSNSL